MGLLALVEHGRAADLDIEIGRTDDQVHEDRVRGLGEVRGAEAGPGRGLGTALLEADPQRVQEERDDERDDPDGGRQADDEGSDP